MKRSELAVAAFTAAYVAASVPAALTSGNDEFVFYIAVMVVLGVLVWVVHRRIGLSLGTLWGLSAWGLAHMLGGLWTVSEETGVLYNLWLVPGRLKYDQVVHAFGFGLSTWVCWQGIRSALADPRPTPGLVFLSALGGMGLGACNEVVEFVATLTMPETNVGGYVNTGWDLVANGVGATLAATAILVLEGRRGKD